MRAVVDIVIFVVEAKRFMRESIGGGWEITGSILLDKKNGEATETNTYQFQKKVGQL